MTNRQRLRTSVEYCFLRVELYTQKAVFDQYLRLASDRVSTFAMFTDRSWRFVLLLNAIVIMTYGPENYCIVLWTNCSNYKTHCLYFYWFNNSFYLHNKIVLLHNNYCIMSVFSSLIFSKLTPTFWLLDIIYISSKKVFKNLFLLYL